MKLTTQQWLRDISERALQGLSGSSKNRIAICELLEYVEKAITERQIFPVVSDMPRELFNKTLLSENDHLRRNLQEVKHQRDLLLSRIGSEKMDGRFKIDEHY